MTKQKGTVKWFNESKGFGFIACDDGIEAFVHYSSIEGQSGFRTLKQGDRVELEIAQSPKGPRAEKVKVLKGNDWL
ncbi:MAG: cold-shock protein [Candidatus Fervidibacter sp.]|uniref:cold-shock protein n=1 Tax=Candidatus Fervidibacter sp. TaxID=3100871 RepID=UPI00404B1E78